MPGLVPPTDGERATLLAYLEQQRYGIRLTAFGLTDRQARLAPTDSALTVGGLIKHVTAVERTWMNLIRGESSDGDGEADYTQGFTMSERETLQQIIADSVACGLETNALIESIDDLGQAVPVPKGVPWFPDDVDAWSVRWVVMHVIEEIARHAGHADIIREHIDGGTMHPIMAAAENWPASPWMQPWRPTGEQLGATGGERES